MARYPMAEWKAVPSFEPGRRGERVLAFVIHSAVGSAAGTFRIFSNRANEASTHFLVRQNGEIDQFIDTNDTAWGNGVCNRTGGLDRKVPWLPNFYGRQPGPNNVTVSTELEGGPIGNESEKLTGPQYLALRRLTVSVLREEGLGAAQRNVNLLEHNQITATACPSGRVPWDRLIADINEEEEEHMAWIAQVRGGQAQYVVTVENGSLKKKRLPNPTVRRDLEKLLGTESVEVSRATLNPMHGAN